MSSADAQNVILCPYCGSVEQAPSERCAGCGGFFDPLSRKVTQQHMGPWYIRDSQAPFRPGFSYEVLTKQIERGKVKPNTILRGPSTKQFWSVARNVPGVAHLVGYCYSCGNRVQPEDKMCLKCNKRFKSPDDRNGLGLDPVDPTIWDKVAQAQAELAAEQSGAGAAPTSPPPGAPAAAKATVVSTTSTRLGTESGPATNPLLGGGSASSGVAAPEAAPPPSERPAPAVATAVAPAAAAPVGPAPDAVNWMTDSGGPGDSLDPLSVDAPATSGSSSNLWIWLLVGLNLLLAAGVLVVMYWNPLTGTTPPPDNPGPAPVTPAAPGTPGTPTPPATNPGSATGPIVTPPSTPTAPPRPPVALPAPPSTLPTPPITAGPSTPAPTPPDRITRPPTTGETRFFGIGETHIEGATPEQIAELRRRWAEVEVHYEAGRLPQALAGAEAIRDSLPPGSKATGLVRSIATIREQIEEKKLNKFFRE
ncbi:MAG: hypothetical protein OER86_03765 [Phycisphaerae bacterium]|nr:hypothetical protein [Phycisphaerae bacterium]